MMKSNAGSTCPQIRSSRLVRHNCGLCAAFCQPVNAFLICASTTFHNITPFPVMSSPINSFMSLLSFIILLQWNHFIPASNSRSPVWGLICYVVVCCYSQFDFAHNSGLFMWMLAVYYSDNLRGRLARGSSIIWHPQSGKSVHKHPPALRISSI